MGKFYNEEYEEVEAFSQEEMEAKLKEEREKIQAELAKEKEEIATKLQEKEKEYETLSKRYDSRKGEYEELKKKYEEVSNSATSTEAEKKAAFEKMRDSYIAKAAGDDQEYAEALRTQFERVGKETLDPTELEAGLKDAHALALNSLNRDFTSFSMGQSASGEPPRVKPDEDKSFTETDAGKSTLEHVYQSMGMEVKPDSDNK